MRFRLLALCFAFAVATTAGCGGSATIPTPPAEVKSGPPPGSAPEMVPTPPKKGDAKK